ncbi:MAG: hypothetical protein JWM99_2663, partial [Verrucomicrobiales bacterium]|nr:hypothetical protein [Verrucomicrobiales bacterium]
MTLPRFFSVGSAVCVKDQDRIPLLKRNRLPLFLLLFSSWTVATFAQSDRVVITNAPGYSISWDGNNGGFSDPEAGASAPDNIALASAGAVAFGSSAFLPGGIHDFPNVIDGFYGNSSSWISDFRVPDTNAFIGVAFGKAVAVSSVAWSRDNGDDTERTPPAAFTDRAIGSYILQFTAVTTPGVETLETGDANTGWATIGGIQYKSGNDNVSFSAYLRHRYDVSAGGKPISATAIRIKVSDGGTDIDEIEVNPPADPTPPITSFILISSNTGYAIDWNGNEGKFYDTNSPALAPKNRALASSGTIAFGSSEFGQGVHFITNVIDGKYGNTHSWISDFTKPDTNAYVGLNFGDTVPIKTIAWSRDNGDDTDCCGGKLQDRAIGVYTLQVTQVATPGVNTSETGDPATGWVTIGTVNYKAAGIPFTPSLRHSFAVSRGGAPINATGLRIKVSDGNMDLDEIEVNPNAALEAISTGLIVITPQVPFSLKWDGNDGEFSSVSAGASAPQNDALAANGSTAFGSGQYFPNGGIHDIDNVIDGLYGNSHSWIMGPNEIDPNIDPAAGTFIGVKFSKKIAIKSIAFGRDNMNQIPDRWQGIYTLQSTTVSDPGVATTETGDPATGWTTLGTIEYTGQAPPDFNPWLRHRYDVASADGSAIQATAIRIKVSSDATDIDEIEVNPSSVPPPPVIITSSGAYLIGWDGNDGLFNDTNAPAKAPSNAALASQGTTAFGSSQYGHGVHLISNVNDGLYGNSHSWIPDFTAAPADPNPFIGLTFGKSIQLRTIAWSRDNGDNAEKVPPGPYTDRALGVYTVQVTAVSNPSNSTLETGNPDTGWATVGTINYKTDTTGFRSYYRHRFEVSSGGNPIAATGIRIKVPSIQTDIDELEVNPQENLTVKNTGGYSISWDGNDGEFANPAAGAAPPDNAALATKGTVAFGSSELDFGGIHLISHINDGLYGNKNSWISDRGVGGGSDTNLFVGLSFGSSITLSNVAWGRDNGDDTERTPAGAFTDRAVGSYTFQITSSANPGVDTAETENSTTGWATVGTIQYRGSDGAFHSWLRHRFEIASTNNSPISATGIRIKVSDG